MEKNIEAMDGFRFEQEKMIENLMNMDGFDKLMTMEEYQAKQIERIVDNLTN